MAWNLCVCCNWEHSLGLEERMPGAIRVKPDSQQGRCTWRGSAAGERRDTDPVPLPSSCERLCQVPAMRWGLFPLVCALKSFGVSHLRVHGLCTGTIGQRRVSLFSSHPPWWLLPSFSVCVCMCGSVVMCVVCMCVVCMCKCSGALVCGGRRRILSVLYHNLPFCRDTEHKPHCLPTLLLDSAGVSSTGDHTRLFTCVLEIWTQVLKLVQLSSPLF